MVIFQSTLPHGSDQHSSPARNLAMISIHAPSRERLDAERFLTKGGMISIHAPSRERRIVNSFFIPSASYFNPRSLTGATYITIGVLICQQNFNPRSLTGATLKARRYINNIVFQSTLPHGSDKEVLSLDSERLISIHAPSRERPIEVMFIKLLLTFQSTLPHGSDYNCVSVAPM